MRKILSSTGFSLSDEFLNRTICFDIIAKRDEKLVIIKALINIDSLNKPSATELKVLSNYLDGSPLVVGQRSGCGRMEDGALYLRYGIPIISPNTAYDYFVEDVPPAVFAAPGGFYVKMNGEVIHRLRKERGLSLGALATKLGVSRKAVQMYEDGMGAMVEIAIKIEDYLEVPVILPSDPLGVEYDSTEMEELKAKMVPQQDEGQVINRLKGLGYDVTPTKRSPFDVLTSKKKILILTGIEYSPRSLKQRARIIHNISQLAEKDSVFFIQNIKGEHNIEGIPAIALKELMNIADSGEIIELIRERA